MKSVIPRRQTEITPTNLTDKELYSLCIKYGTNALKWLKRFGGLLPEIYRRRLYRKHGCASIHEFAKKAAGMNERTVDKILNLRRKLEGKPELLRLFESGTQGWSKLEKVAYIATQETDKEWAEKVKILPYHSLAIQVKDYRSKITGAGQAESKNLISQEQQNQLEFQEENKPFLYQESHKTFSFPISPKLEQKLNIFKQNLEKQKKETLCWNEIFEEMARRATAISSKQKQQTILIKLCPKCTEEKGRKTKSRPIPTDIKRLIDARFGNTCAFPNCNKAATEYHHIKRHALSKNHNPNNIVPLCKEHHDLAHTGLIANEQNHPEKWRLRKKTDKNNPIYKIDEKVQKHKNPH